MIGHQVSILQGTFIARSSTVLVGVRFINRVILIRLSFSNCNSYLQSFLYRPPLYVSRLPERLE